MKNWKKLATGGGVLALAASAALALTSMSSAASTADATTVSLPRLQHLGEQLNLSAGQQQQWQAALASVAQARDLMRTQNTAMLASAQAELQKPDANITKLFETEDHNQTQAQQARLVARQALMAFYASATPEQQAQIRTYASQQLGRLSSLQNRFRSMRAFAG